jgi:hypothetical protein
MWLEHSVPVRRGDILSPFSVVATPRPTLPSLSPNLGFDTFDKTLSPAKKMQPIRQKAILSHPALPAI